MRVPEKLASAFGAPFEELIGHFASEEGLIPEGETLGSPRFLARSVAPHIRKLSSLFNRAEKEQGDALDPYWKKSANPVNLRLAYFLYFMPANLYRVASVWAELGRLGYRWPESATKLRAIEFGAGPAAGATGIAAGEHHARLGLPAEGNWALIEQDRAMLELGTRWAGRYFADQGFGRWETRPFHRKINLSAGAEKSGKAEIKKDFKKGAKPKANQDAYRDEGTLLPSSAPRFNLWVMSYFLNELELPPEQIAAQLWSAWQNHLEEEGIVILVEPALKQQSRKLLEIRRELLKLSETPPAPKPGDRRGPRANSEGNENPVPMQLLLPCLGHQACGALAEPTDWCHEEVSWWRPPYFRTLDKFAELDRKTLPFSYLVWIKSRRSRAEILPALAGSPPENTRRLVSPAHWEGKEQEFYLCGPDGKERSRNRPATEEDELDRGDILLNTEIRGDRNSSRIVRGKKLLPK